MRGCARLAARQYSSRHQNTNAARRRAETAGRLLSRCRSSQSRWRRAAAEHGSAVAYDRGTYPAPPSGQRPFTETDERGDVSHLFRRFVREESGQDIIEYGLLLSIVTLTLVTAIPVIAERTTEMYDRLLGILP